MSDDELQTYMGPIDNLGTPVEITGILSGIDPADGSECIFLLFTSESGVPLFLAIKREMWEEFLEILREDAALVSSAVHNFHEYSKIEPQTMLNNTPGP